MAKPGFEFLNGILVALSRKDSKAKTVKAIQLYSVTLDIASLSADTDATQTVTLTGVAVGDAVVVIPPSTLEANVQVTGPWVSAADTVKFIVENETAGAIDPASATWKFLVFKF